MGGPVLLSELSQDLLYIRKKAAQMESISRSMVQIEG